MREWRRCPRCGHVKAGACPGCYPAEAQAEQAAELAEWREQLADEERRAAGMLYCPQHERHDGCWEFVRPGPERRTMTWQEAMSQLRRRYVSP
jgi:hypothetical protein